jgi:hypothetical protein
LAARTASSSVENRAIPATGPNVSSRAIAISGRTSTRTVGSKNVRPSSCGFPPLRSCAPPSIASSTWRITFAKPALSMIGPTETPASVPEPTFNLVTDSTSFSR